MSLADDKQAVYAEGLRALVRAQVPFLVGGGYALYAYLGRWRATKDIDIFLSEDALEPALYALARAGFSIEITDATWLAKAQAHGALIDIIFCSYNGLYPVDQRWLANGRAAEVLGVPVKVVGPEEMIVSKCFVAARDRFDGGDVSWLLRVLGPRLDWPRIEALMRDHWQVLLWQLIHFLYVFPSERRTLPADVLGRLIGQLRRELAEPPGDPRVCRGPLLDPKLYRQEVARRIAPMPDDAPLPREAADEPRLVEPEHGRVDE